MSFDEKLDSLIVRHETLSDGMLNPNITPQEYAKISKEYSDLGPIADEIRNLRKSQQELHDIEVLLKDPTLDSEFKKLSEQEVFILKKANEELELKIKVLLLPKDEADAKNAIIEVRAGTGGEEAALFATMLFRMYQRYAEIHHWKFETLSMNETDIGGIKEATGIIAGKNVFERLKFESGVHRVQRVPMTEASGRVHTSTATVAVLPEAEEVDVNLEDKDLRIDVYRASGAGGQHVNTTDSCVRITHIPTGIVVTQQDERSQHKNKAKAMKILRSRIYEMEREKKQNERSILRKDQVGTGERSERIRTYNFPQGRVSDHRINLTVYKLERIVEGGELDEVIEALIADDQATKLSEV